MGEEADSLGRLCCLSLLTSLRKLKYQGFIPSDEKWQSSLTLMRFPSFPQTRLRPHGGLPRLRPLRAAGGHRQLPIGLPSDRQGMVRHSLLGSDGTTSYL